MKTIGIAIVSFLILGVTPNTQPQQSKIILMALPTVRVVTNGMDDKGKPKLCIEEELSPKDMVNNAIEIIKIGNRYFWKTRQNTEMVKTISGIYIQFTAKKGVGYVKFVHPSFEVQMGIKKDDLKITEHVHHGITGINYYGKSFTYTE